MSISRNEFIGCVFGLVVMLVVLTYCAVMIRITREGVREHREYIRGRDVRWEGEAKRLESSHAEIITRLQRIEGK
jgi:hypothetical protein